MSKIKIILIVAVLVVFGGVSIFIISNNSNTIPSTPSKNEITVSASTTLQYTLAQVLTHSSVSSCWSAVNGRVYDLTPWISKHPGGSEAILSMCGKDASSAFNDQHSGQKRPANELSGFMIANLAK